MNASIQVGRGGSHPCDGHRIPQQLQQTKEGIHCLLSPRTGRNIKISKNKTSREKNRHL